MPSWCLNVRQVKILEEAAEEAIEAAACSENELTIIRLSGNSQNSNLIKISFLLVNNLIIVFSSKCNKDHPPRRFVPHAIAFATLFAVASLGRTTFWFTWLSCLWVLFTGDPARRDTPWYRFFLSLFAASLLYPLYEIYSGQWGTQVEAMVRQATVAQYLITAYRHLPAGWLVVWFLLSIITFALSSRLPFIALNQKTVRNLTGLILAFSVVQAFAQKDHLFYLAIALGKWFVPSGFENSAFIHARWQPMVLEIHPLFESVALFLIVAGLTAASYRLLRTYGLRAWVFIFPLIPFVFYLSASGGGRTATFEGFNVYYVCSRYLIYLSPLAILLFISFLPLQRSLRALTTGIVLTYVGWHFAGIDNRLARTALTEMANTFANLFPYSATRFDFPPHSLVKVSPAGVGDRTLSPTLLQKLKLPTDFGEHAFLFQVNAFAPYQIEFSREEFQLAVCTNRWCDGSGKTVSLPQRYRDHQPLYESLVLKKNETAGDYLRKVGATNWPDWIRQSWKVVPFTGHVMEYFLEESYSAKSPMQ